MFCYVLYYSYVTFGVYEYVLNANARQLSYTRNNSIYLQRSNSSHNCVNHNCVSRR